MKTLLAFLRKELMLTLSLAAAVIALIISPPTKELLGDIDWRTLGILLMMLCVLEGFKQEKLLSPLVRLAGRFKSPFGISAFLVFGVFFSSMFVTNDVSLIIFVPLTIMIFRSVKLEKYILPVISMENIAAIRGSLLTPFGSPQNLFLYGKAGVSVWHFMLHMLPLNVLSAVLLTGFVAILHRKDRGVRVEIDDSLTKSEQGSLKKKVMYYLLFAVVLGIIVTRTEYWYMGLLVVLLPILAIDRKLFAKVDYVLIVTFLCFFVFSSSITRVVDREVFTRIVAGNEYWWAIGISQIISNVPATIVLYPFTTNFAGLIYGADTAGLCSLIGSLASVINYRIYVREYPGNGGQFIKVFTLISWAFFLIVVIPGYLLSKWRFF